MTLAHVQQGTLKQILFIAAATPLLTSCGNPPDFQKLNGEWFGVARGKTLRGHTTMSMKDGKFTWVLPDGRINHCSLSGTPEKIKYSCSLGSVGSFTISNGQIRMKQIHGAYRVKFRRSKLQLSN